MPLAATWLMMAAEGPFLAAVIARLADPKYNLAAYGVAYAFALIVEAPIIMMMSASTALVKDKHSFLRLRNFTYALNGILTLGMIILVIPPVFYFITGNLIGLPEDVSRLTHNACIILLPWPGAIGYRRFYQGILIRANLTRRVAYGTIVRLSSMAATATILYLLFRTEGAVVGAAALSAGVTMEAIASRLMAYSPVKRLRLQPETIAAKDAPLTYGAITKFYYPLALTSILALGVQPMVTFFVGQSRMAIESLAVLPVLTSLVFIFRSVGLSFQEVGIALMGENNEGYLPLRNFASMLGIIVVGLLGIIAFTPFSFFWFNTVSGLSLNLTRFAIPPTRVMVLMPGLTLLLAFQRALLVSNNKTAPITMATSIEVVGIVCMLVLTINHLDMVGALAASLAFVVGRLCANGYLFVPYFKVLRKYQPKPLVLVKPAENPNQPK